MNNLMKSMMLLFNQNDTEQTKERVEPNSEERESSKYSQSC